MKTFIGMTISPKIQRLNYEDDVFGNSEIIILDDCFNYNEINLIYMMCIKRSYYLGNQSRQDVQNNPHDRLVSELSDDDIVLSGLLDKKRRNIFSPFLDMSSNIQSAYVNLGVKSDIYNIHMDYMGRKQHHVPKTFLYYANMEWKPNWGGSTLLYNSSGEEIVKAIEFKPGRVAIFDSRIPHMATPATSAGPAYRFTIAFKFIGTTNV